MKRIVATLLIAGLGFGAGPAYAQVGTVGETATESGESTDADLSPADQRQTEFDAHMASAKEAFDSGDLIGSVAWMKRAYELKTDAEILYNIGRIYEQLGRFEQSISHYKRFVVAPGVDQELRQDAIARIKTIQEAEQLTTEPQSAASTDASQLAPEPNVAATAPPPEPNYTLAYITIPLGLALVGTGVLLTILSGLKTQEADDMLHEAEHLTDAEERHHEEDHAAELQQQAKIMNIASIPSYVLGGISMLIGVYVVISPPKREVAAINSPRRAPDVSVGFSFRF